MHCGNISTRKNNLESIAVCLSRFWAKDEQNLDYYNKLEIVNTSKAIARKCSITEFAGIFPVWGQVNISGPFL